MAGKEPEIGPTARTVAKNIEDLRTAQNMNYKQLSERLERVASWSINAVGIRRIESGERRVTPDDLMALAVVLGVSPASLLMPDLATVAQDDLVPITGWQKPITASVVWRWLTAYEPLIHGTLGTFIDRALPSWERAEYAKRFAPIPFRGEDGHTDGDD